MMAEGKIVLTITAEDDYLELLKYRAIGTVSELLDLIKATEKGRLVVLPCKVGDVWYEVDTPAHGVITHTCTAVYGGFAQNDGLVGRPKDGIRDVVIIQTHADSEDDCHWTDGYTLGEYEQRIRTREEAEAAIKTEHKYDKS